MIQISFENENLATQLAIYLADSLDSNSYKLKPAKSIHHLTRKGSRQFRKTLRSQKDDVLRKFASSSDPLVAKMCQEIRTQLFDETVMLEDDSNTEEERPRMTFSGMGGGGSESGFGNTPISKENLGHKVLDIIDKAMNVPDERAEVLKSCLINSPTGDYEPVSISMTASSMKMSQMSLEPVLVGKKHVPGKAGGGWESSDEEDEETTQIDEEINSSNDKCKVKDIMVESAWYDYFVNYIIQHEFLHLVHFAVRHLKIKTYLRFR